MKNDGVYLLIVDYNLTRFDDVRFIAKDAKIRYGLETLLIKKNVAEMFSGDVAAVIDLDPRQPDFVGAALSALQNYREGIVAGMVFSDNAVVSGAELLEQLKMKVDSSKHAMASYSKKAYRIAEQKLADWLAAQNIHVPQFSVAHSPEEIATFGKSWNGSYVLKPFADGNNHGVMKISEDADIEYYLENMSHYLVNGLICEEYIGFEWEYSFDGLKNLFFITEKRNSNNAFPVEVAQIVPAIISPSVKHAICRAGMVANLIVGQNIGPFHNEVKVDIRTGKTAVMEPNRRPAGMRIWNLAQKVYGVNFYQLWLDELMGVPLPEYMPEPTGMAVTVALPAPLEGVLSLPGSLWVNPDALVKKWKNNWSRKTSFAAEKIEWFDFRYIAKNGTETQVMPRNNGEFLAQICIYSRDGFSVDVNSTTALSPDKIISELHETWFEVISPYISSNEKLFTAV